MNCCSAGGTRSTRRTPKGLTLLRRFPQRYTLKSKKTMFQPFCSRKIKERRKKSRRQISEALYYTHPMSLAYRPPCRYLNRSRIHWSRTHSCKTEGTGWVQIARQGQSRTWRGSNQRRLIGVSSPIRHNQRLAWETPIVHSLLLWTHHTSPRRHLSTHRPSRGLCRQRRLRIRS